jgi:hypothetical protein
MSSDSDEVRLILSALLIKIDSCKEDLSMESYNGAVYGVRRMNRECSEVHNVLEALERLQLDNSGYFHTDRHI